ncbi:MAG TPA: YCF48-related protein [Pyrinomonadaceae bacterium]|nr:YCF48-related protein [Pyrinomonadaceae bacterium]
MRDFKFEISNLKSLRPGINRPVAALFCLLLTAHCLPLAAHSSSGAWAKQKSGTLAWLHAVYFVDERRGWAVGGKGALLSTEDGGARWELRRAPVEDTLNDIFFTDERTGWVACERSIYLLKTKEEHRSYLLKTEDGGESWRRVEVAGADVDARIVRVRFADRERGWAFGEMGALYATSDGGQTWARQRVPTKHLLLGGAFLDARQGWLVGAGSTLLHTSDGGETWREGRLAGQTPPIPANHPASSSPASAPSSPNSARPNAAPSVRFNAVSFAGERRGWAVGFGGAVFSTDDGGRTWRAQRSNVSSDLWDVKFFDEREGVAVGGDGTAIHTSDGGQTWRAEPTGTPHTLERLFFAGRTRGWAVGFGGTIITIGRKG